MSENARLMRYDELNNLLGLYKHLHPNDPDVTANQSLESLWNEIYNDPSLHYILIE